MKLKTLTTALFVGTLTLMSVVSVWAAKAPVAQAADELVVKCTQNTRTMPLYDVFEITFQHDGHHANPFFDVSIEVMFASPSGKKVPVGGFHYGSSAGTKITSTLVPAARGDRRKTEYLFEKQNMWKARYAPNELGRWSYSYVFANTNGGKAAGNGSFDCLKTRAPLHGFVRQHPTNPFRWVFDDGSPFFPIGIQECIADGSGAGSVLAAQSMEGPFRLDRQNRPEPPPGALFKPGPAMNPVNGDVYFRNYAQAGFDLFRFSQKNCSLELYQNPDQYLVQEGVMVDELLREARKYRYRILYGLFGYQPVFNDHPDNAEGLAKLKRFVKYSVDRWGAYADFWEFLNEQKADARWYEVMVPYLRSLDPYHHPITTSWERPELPGIEVNAPHWYSGLKNELDADQETAAHALNWKRFNKPVIVGEQGNSASKEQLQTPGIGGVWDVGSSTRMRLRNWTALFKEISLVFWNTSYAKDGHSMNIWLGPQERQFVHAMQDFAYRLDQEVRMTSVTLSEHKAVRGYGLASSRRAGVYLHHFADHTNAVTNLAVTLDVSAAAKGYWYSPENAAILRRLDVASGRQTFEVPPFQIDIALLITPDGPPDIDHDGLANDLDPDDDNDGVPDTADAFPLDPEEWADQDGDLIGDNLDADIDADGVGDDKNKNGIPDFEEMDFDGDGVLKANVVPWDAFPLDPKERRDTDGDGIGDNSDTDKDGDGWSDEEERKAGTDPLDRLSFPVEKQSAQK